MKKIWYAWLMLIIIAGCSHKKNLQDRFQRSLQQKEMIAKCTDLPDAPFQAQLESIAVAPDHHDQIQIFYKMSMPVQDVMDFYIQQMERLGWDLIAQSIAQDCILHFSKPYQLCSFIIEDKNLSIYLCNKQGA